MRALNRGGAALALLMAGVSAVPAWAAEVEKVPGGVVVTPDRGPAKKVRVLVYGADRFRVSATPTTEFNRPDSIMVVAKPDGAFTISEARGTVTVKAERGSATIRLSDGQVSFANAAGTTILTEAARGAFQPVTVEGEQFVAVNQQFNRGTDEGFFGLGQHQNGQMNYNGEDVELAQHNMSIAIPFVVSTNNYGVLWDNESITRFGDPVPYAHVGSRDDAGLTVTSGGKPGWKAEYFLDDKPAVTRQESTINYEYIRDQKNWPEAAKAQTVAATTGQNTAGNAVQQQRVVWTGTLNAKASGTHKFKLYSSHYVKVFADGKEVLSRWRQNWNPWYHNFELPMTAGKTVDLRIEWSPNAGYIALYHNDPMPAQDRKSLWLSSELAKNLDYYVVTGDNLDQVVAGYRSLTGQASMMPKWAYGFWQSRQRYNTQDELLGVVREYRKREFPIDNIVQDWFYWPENAWGSHEFEKARFPDPKGMVDEVHALNARIMISVWPKFYPTTDNAKELDAKGWLYRRPLEAGQLDWVGKGYPNTFYNPYTKGARELYYKQIEDKLVGLGFDAWWMDATEPDWHSNLSVEERKFQMSHRDSGVGAARFNSYPLIHADGMADGLRGSHPDQRPFILTRSGYAGVQRASSALWSGDVAARWDDLRDQISAGVNLSMAGVPNWTHDIGGFAVEDRYTKQDPAHVAEWRELNLRWFQFGTFSPLFRSHGEFPLREVYSLAGDDQAAYQSMLDYTRLRYRLLPYIYTLAADTHFKSGTIMRGLAMDFPADRKGWDVDDQYLFGPAFLVAPVTEFKATSRTVWLPAGADWYDFATGRHFKGGQTITADAPRERMPLFVRAGSIVPTGPAVQYTSEQPDGPLVLHVFAGADASFDLYEDDGTSMGFDRGEFARTPIRWDDKAGTLTIGARQGSYPGMAGKRGISVRVYRPGGTTAPSFEAGSVQVVYDGKAVTLGRDRLK
ncbi:TIM-barrel domain-containing protein [Sphingomonas sp. FW199]|uniref:glycoside hydrolase family 31 protein n=1 Tax=Sphingomonas sp. FW199 TaxID=3400217 RepID=UPI003CF7701A